MNSKRKRPPKRLRPGSLSNSVAAKRITLPRIAVKSSAPFRRADFFCLNEAKDHADTPNDALWAAIDVARHGGEPGERERFRRRPGTSGTVVHKWRLFRALTEAKTALGVTDRALSVLARVAVVPSGNGVDAAGRRSARRRRRRGGDRRHRRVPVQSRTVDPRPWHGAGDATPPSRLPSRSRTDHPPQFPEWQTLCPKRAGGRDRKRLRLRPDAAGRARRRNRKPRRGSAGRKQGRQAAARTHHAAAARHRQDDRDRAGGGRSRRLAGVAPALCGAIEPLRAQFIACRSGGVGERTCRIERRNPERSGKPRKSPKKERQ